ncbi:hypothetical protein QE369_001175 [Agrobacterium larrymoorei]|uniref:Uncharacterized protein n=2 Tax=Agrobacterium larrymoorei TaxID=160699 RepID=A0AAJ2BAI8_9HYPH|nr:hypothetical protein [Agrobacterium larrymoorei]
MNIAAVSSDYVARSRRRESVASAYCSYYYWHCLQPWNRHGQLLRFSIGTNHVQNRKKNRKSGPHRRKMISRPVAATTTISTATSYEQWTRLADARGISLTSKAALKRRWEADPEHELFPRRYRDWGYRPTLRELMYDLTAPYWQADAFAAIKLMSPAETHQYLDEAYATDLGDLLMCRAGSSGEITKNFQSAAVGWEIRKRREAEEAKRERELSRKNDGDQGIPEPN